jgi:hypothetical protein
MGKHLRWTDVRDIFDVEDFLQCRAKNPNMYRVFSINFFDLGKKFLQKMDLLFLLIAKLLVHLAEKSGRDLAAVQRISIQHPVVRPTAVLRRSGGGRKRRL